MLARALAVGALLAPRLAWAVPTLSLMADPVTIAPGATATLIWSTTNTAGATVCTAEGGWSGFREASGRETVTPTVTTSYRLTCTDATGDATKTRTVTVEGDDCEAVETCTIGVPGRQCTFELTYAEQETHRIMLGTPTGTLVPRWRLRNADGTPALDCGGPPSLTGHADCGPLPAADYQLEVSAASGVGTVPIRLQNLTGCQSTRVGCDQTARAQISPVGDTDLFRFTVAEQERVNITVPKLTGMLATEWRLLTIGGEKAGTCDTFRRVPSDDCGPLPAGDYQINVRDELSTRTGEYAVHLQRLTAARACDATPIACDQTRFGEIDPGAESDLFSFTVPDQERVRIVLEELDGPLIAAWRLLTATGAPAASCGIFDTKRMADCGPLAAGDYLVHVRDSTRQGTGSYAVSLFFLTAGACPNCGNNIIEEGEECDPPGGCCTQACQVATAGAICRAPGGPCDAPETCSGDTIACPDDILAAAGVVCRPATGICDRADTCSGRSAICPANAFQPAGTECRTAAGPCDLPETCSGFDAVCPETDRKRTTICRLPAGTCDLPERCDGVGDQCPADRLVAAGTVCRPATDRCDVEEICPGGTAVCPADELAALQCGDGCLDRREQCGEEGLEACPRGETCVGCLCVPCASAAPLCALPPGPDGLVQVDVALDAGIDTVGAWSGTLAWDPALLRLDAIEGGSTAGFTDAPACVVDATAGLAACQATLPLGSAGVSGTVSVALARLTALGVPARRPEVTLSLDGLSTPDGVPIRRCLEPGGCAVPECGAVEHCDDDVGCTTDLCSDASCVHERPLGIPGAECAVTELARKLTCDGEPVGGRLERKLVRRLRKAQRLLARAEGATGRKLARLLVRADNRLRKTQRKLERAGRLTLECREALSADIDERRGLVAALEEETP